VRRGEVWVYERPDYPPRPHVILTRNEAVAGLDKLVAAPTTRTVRKSLLTDRITTLGPEKMIAVCRALSAATSCY
jgi:mRNA-degrading endonuclease toxin of MazEF toxin-antitoxin module